MNIASEADYDENYKIAVLLKRVHHNLVDVLIPHLAATNDSECQRLLKIVNRFPIECEQNLALTLSKLNLYKNNNRAPTL